MGRACSTYGGDENAYIFVRKPEGKRHSEDLNVDGKTIVK
jgi:hypothetical protein